MFVRVSLVTIRTSDYEQNREYQTEGHIRQTSIVWNDREDLSAPWQSQFESL